jgi:hypothetical protein
MSTTTQASPAPRMSPSQMLMKEAIGSAAPVGAGRGTAQMTQEERMNAQKQKLLKKQVSQHDNQQLVMPGNRQRGVSSASHTPTGSERSVNIVHPGKPGGIGGRGGAVRGRGRGRGQ